MEAFIKALYFANKQQIRCFFVALLMYILVDLYTYRVYNIDIITNHIMHLDGGKIYE